MTSKPQFFLKTAALPGEPDSPYTNLYLRLHGSGIDSVVLTPSPPKLIKAHLEDDKRISFTSAAHEGRCWGLTLCMDGKQRVGWEKVEIVENSGSGGLVFKTGSDRSEILECDEEDGGQGIWGGWMVCEWATGHPHLFWVTEKLKGDLPSFCHRVQVVREHV